MKQRKILVVDDEQNIRDIISEFLSELGYEVSVAVDGLDALGKIQSTRYDLYIIDVYMPRMGGLELIGKLKEMQPLAVIIVTTGFSSIDVAIRAIRTGAYHYLTKPIQPDELIKVVGAGLSHVQDLYEQGGEDMEMLNSPEIKSTDLLLLKGFNAEQRKDFIATGVLISYSKGSPIPLNEEMGTMVMVEAGSVNAYYNGAMVETLVEHDVWGEETFINPSSIFTTLSAQTDVQIRHFKRRKIVEFFTYNEVTLTKRYMINLIQCIYIKWRRSCFRMGLQSGFNT